MNLIQFGQKVMECHTLVDKVNAALGRNDLQSLCEFMEETVELIHVDNLVGYLSVGVLFQRITSNQIVGICFEILDIGSDLSFWFELEEAVAKGIEGARVLSHASLALFMVTLLIQARVVCSPIHVHILYSRRVRFSRSFVGF